MAKWWRLKELTAIGRNSQRAENPKTRIPLSPPRFALYFQLLTRLGRALAGNHGPNWCLQALNHARINPKTLDFLT
jgi:hypothetical protein